MILASAARRLDFPPAIVFGFASCVSTAVARSATGSPGGIVQSALLAAFALLVGALFGIASEWFANMLTTRPPVVSQAR